ncbi:MAG: response regulator transcription factor [Candidatus Acidiferrum sp.]
MKPVPILLIDDDVELCSSLKQLLSMDGFDVTAVHDGDSGVRHTLEGEYELVILDVMLPGGDGRKVLRRIRLSSQVPVIMLTARGDEADRIAGLERGADDYLPKPFNPRELVARMRAVLRRKSGSTPQEIFKIGDLQINCAQRRVVLHGNDVALTGAEFDILLLLVRSAGKVLSREEIAEAALGRPVGFFDRSIDNHISNLRKKLGCPHRRSGTHSERARRGLLLHRRHHQGAPMIRGIYAKIFLWFLLATGIMGLAIFLITVATHMPSLGPSWMIGVLDQYTRSAVNIYEHGGKDRLAEYLQEIQDASFLQSTLLDPEGRDILGRGVPPGAEQVLAKARATGETQFHTGVVWTGASVDSRPEGRYILVAKVLIPYGLFSAARSTPRFLHGSCPLCLAHCFACSLRAISRGRSAPCKAWPAESRMEISQFARIQLWVRAKTNWPTSRGTLTGWRTASKPSCANNWSSWEIYPTNCDPRSPG